jgi:putative oxygen-independent coproporphyrinogen III oxidase
MIELPPLSLYVHFPWCAKKCPYCDFNSHPVKGPLPEAQYLDQLLRDLDCDIARAGRGRTIQTVFFGGGTPSLISGSTIAVLLAGIGERIDIDRNAEITLEANPGAIDERNFVAYLNAGVNRLSIGAQSFDAAQLRALGRIHTPGDIEHAVRAARAAGFSRINLDLMHGLPGQTPECAAADLRRAIDLGVPHISWYQLTIEARTEFALHPPALPDEDALGAIEDRGLALLHDAGFSRYEVSAFCRPGDAARHNLNYWTFGDYLGIGAGAHGKYSFPESGEVVRSSKPLAPARYLGTPANDLRSEAIVSADALPGEFLLNALRLIDGVDAETFSARTGVASTTIDARWTQQQRRGLMRGDRLGVTPLGLRYLDTVISEFL